MTMKTIAVILLLTVAAQIGVGQNRDSTLPMQRVPSPGTFVDQDGDGVNDLMTGNKKNKRDKFIDANGDGICDSREQGLGFKRKGVQSTAGTGKQLKQFRGGRK